MPSLVLLSANEQQSGAGAVMASIETSLHSSTAVRLRDAAYAYAETVFASADPSHDIHHVRRVAGLALDFAADFVPGIDLLVVELAAIFHDLTDKKYLPPGATPVDASTRLREWFSDNEGLEDDRRTLVCRIVDNVSYSKEVKRIAAGQETDWHRSCPELHCVQDADKLDALGAIGKPPLTECIMRCAAYSVVINRPLIPDSASASETHGRSLWPPLPCALDHFDDKLFRLEGMMKTAKGKAMAQQRTVFMRAFVEQCRIERESNPRA